MRLGTELDGCAGVKQSVHLDLYACQFFLSGQLYLVDLFRNFLAACDEVDAVLEHLGHGDALFGWRPLEDGFRGIVAQGVIYLGDGLLDLEAFLAQVLIFGAVYPHGEIGCDAKVRPCLVDGHSLGRDNMSALHMSFASGGEKVPRRGFQCW